MFKVQAESLNEYFAFDPERKGELEKLDKLIRASAPKLKRYFHTGTPAGQPGMRFKMIGYGKSHYTAKSGQLVEWPIVGVALQKNYISVYVSVRKNGVPLVSLYADTLNWFRASDTNFSFVTFEEMNEAGLRKLFADAEKLGHYE